MEFRNYRSTELYRLMPESPEHLVLVKQHPNMDKTWTELPILDHNIQIGDKVFLFVNGKFFEATCIERGF